MDTSGQEVFKSINQSYYRKADCCLLVYDISEETTFEECKEYYNKEIKEKCNKNIKVVLLGNKTDLKELRAVKTEDAIQFAKENGYIFMETSCITNENIADAFQTLIEITHFELEKGKKEEGNIINNKEENKENNNISITREDFKKKNNEKKKFKCC